MDVEIIPWEERYAEDFIRLSLEWLREYDLLEPLDEEIIRHPHARILDGGGMIWFARAGEEIVGTVGVIRENAEVFEGIKLAVTRSFRGRGLSRKLVDTAIDYCRKQGGKKLYFYTNHRLTAAMGLYRGYAFRQQADDGAHYETSDLRMEMEL